MRDALLACVPESRAQLAVVQSPAQVRVRMGRATQVLLESAGDPFADPDERAFLPRFPALRLAAVALGVLTLGGALWFMTTGDESAAPTRSELVAHAPATPAVPSLPAPPPPLVAHPAEPARAPSAQAPAQELPIGADVPEEDLPASVPAELRSARSKPHASTHERRPERARAPAPNAESTQPASSASRDRPIPGKVVRQLDF
jgi:hypothetical protein